MKISIRKFLLINLLITIIATTLITALGNYYLDQRDIETHLDVVLSQVSLTVNALLDKDFSQPYLQQLQSNLNAIPHTSKEIFTKTRYRQIFNVHEKYQFQVTNEAGQLLLHSASAPPTPLTYGKQGFSDVSYDGFKWRTFTIYNQKLKIYVTAVEKYDSRLILAHRIAIDDIYIMLLTYPIAGILIWLIVGRGLSSIRRVTDEVSHRAPNYLEPVDPQSVPKEIMPLVIELNKLFMRLHQALEREKRFAGDAAHELRTPLAALKTQAQVALRVGDDRERRQLLHNVITGVDRCAHVVQQLLTLSRLVPESNTLSDTSMVDLSKLTAEIVAQVAPLAIEKQIDIELIAEDKSAFIDGNITALSILIRNLVDNSIRYTPESGEVKVTVYSTTEHVVLKVSDNGPGIPAELRARVFERFFRVLGNKSPGSGLGLAIVQQIAKLHQAHVKLGPPASGRGLEVEVVFKKFASQT